MILHQLVQFKVNVDPSFCQVTLNSRPPNTLSGKHSKAQILWLSLALDIMMLKLMFSRTQLTKEWLT